MAATMTFEYAVRDRAGKLVKGKIDADSQAAVASKLKSMGYAPVSIIAGQQRRHEDRDLAPGLRREGQAQGPGDLLAPVRDDDQLRPVAAARADDPEEQTENKELAKVLAEVRSDVETGQSLSAVAGQAPARSSRR